MILYLVMACLFHCVLGLNYVLGTFRLRHVTYLAFLSLTSSLYFTIPHFAQPSKLHIAYWIWLIASVIATIVAVKTEKSPDIERFMFDVEQLARGNTNVVTPVSSRLTDEEKAKIDEKLRKLDETHSSILKRRQELKELKEKRKEEMKK